MELKNRICNYVKSNYLDEVITDLIEYEDYIFISHKSKDYLHTLDKKLLGVGGGSLVYSKSEDLFFEIHPLKLGEFIPSSIINDYYKLDVSNLKKSIEKVGFIDYNHWSFIENHLEISDYIEEFIENHNHDFKIIFNTSLNNISICNFLDKFKLAYKIINDKEIIIYRRITKDINYIC